MNTTAKIVGVLALCIAAYGLGYYQRGTAGNGDSAELRISVDGSEDGMKLKALAPGDVLSVSAMEVNVLNETAPDQGAQFPHVYGTQCPLKDRDPAKVVGRKGNDVLMEVVDRTPDGLFDAGDRVVRQDMDTNVSRTVFYCPVGTLFLMDRRHADIERVTHLSMTASRQRQQQVGTSERALVRDLLHQAGGQ
jgi:hypothetical protein